ncbi:Na(+)-translocating NADH-quinone reductase subunit C [Paraferrimonas sedimenticola]|uniref:Na(+)-translocating NADH-quinone reductase subunit C n=1 Tax=Paraferrimonas sedimenticola TaxID=375674 RepID=A0AA37VYA9_9GAMM|nr:Na(+)-translocating NADH-quinone reductase subunit C [Paraferrimonas sedimenticola]GLP96789.1 Na(+)-translocating NADH-quinone reductase subunit C [Paraferrimonas sedimenticola]
MSKSNDSFGKTLFVVIGLCLVCSIIVSSAAVALKPMQVANAKLDRQKYILQAAGYETTDPTDITQLYNRFIEARVVNLETGEYVEGIDADYYDQRKAAREFPTSSVPENDVAKVKRYANNALVYLVKDGQGVVSNVILPVHGAGLWSTMYAFVALESDLNTIKSMVYYEQKETAGLGSEVQNPEWQAKFVGKKLFDEQGEFVFKVSKVPSIAQGPHGVDALSGATLTANGVQNSLQFWLSEEAFGPYLEKVRQGGLG